MPETATEIGDLVDAYREARTTILGMPEGFERNVALAALRLEAMHAYRELDATARGIDSATLSELGRYAANLRGGERVESSVDALDNQVKSFATRVLKDLWALLTTGVFVGVLGIAANVLLVAALAAQSFGAFIFGALIAGGSVAIFVLRAGAVAGQMFQSIWDGTWGWASGLGAAADRILGDAREKQARVLQRYAAGGLAMQRFTDRVRTRAQLVVGFAWAAVGVAAVLIVIGFAAAANDWWSESPANPENQLPGVPSPSITFTEPLDE
jgi:hypothetical protein